MKLRNILLSILLFSILISCSSDDDQKDCTKHFLDEFDMIPYDGKNITNEFFLKLYEHKDTYFALLGSHVADLVPQMPIDCDGNKLCVTEYDQTCYNLIFNARRIDIIGIEN